MESLSALEIRRSLQEDGITIFTTADLQRRFRITNINTAYKALQRLTAKGLLTRIRDGVYQVSDRPVHDFVLANTMVTPSYVSLESALSRYGILSQAPLLVASVTARKGRAIETKAKTYTYAHIAAHLFTGFVKEAGYLIASPAKALFDTVYLTAKGVRSLDMDELDMTTVDKQEFFAYCEAAKTPQLREYLKHHPIL